MKRMVKIIEDIGKGVAREDLKEKGESSREISERKSKDVDGDRDEDMDGIGV